MDIVFVFRSEKLGFFSIEKVYGSIITSLEHLGVNCKKVCVPCERAKIICLIRNCIFCYKLKKNNRNSIFHVTGDIHYVVPFLPRERTILTIHDFVGCEQRRGLSKFIFQLLWYTIPIMYSKWIILISPKIYDDFVIKYPRYKQKAIMIPDPLSGTYTYSDSDINDMPTILQIGTTANKNLDRVVESIKDIHCRFRIIGKLSKKQEEHLDNSGIFYTNDYGLTDDEISLEYSKADIVIFVSTYEGFGMPIIEAQASGKVVVTSDIEPMKTVSGGAAVLVNPYDISSIKNGVNRAISDKALRKELRVKGLKNVENYMPDYISKEYAKLYNELQLQYDCNTDIR